MAIIIMIIIYVIGRLTPALNFPFEKRRSFEEWLQRRDRVAYNRYRAQRVAMKLAVQAAKRMIKPSKE